MSGSASRNEPERAEAYGSALQKAGNQDYKVVAISGVAYSLVLAKMGCLNER
jgi:hypothetical protein